MAIADWIREATEKRRQRIWTEEYAKGFAEGYDDALNGRPRRFQKHTNPPPSAVPTQSRTPSTAQRKEPKPCP